MSKQKTWLPTEQNIEEYNLLVDMLHSQRIEFDLLSRKKTDGQLNPMKIKMINRVLEPLNELFKHEDSYKFLDTLNEEDMPTNSDVVLIISQYETAIIKFKSKYYVIDEYQRDEVGYKFKRWMTKEFPPDYYADKKQ